MKSNVLKSVILLSIASTTYSPAFSAQPIDLTNKNVNFLKSFLASPTSFAMGSKESSGLKEVSSETDFNGTNHVRIKQTYGNYPVWGGDAIIHTRTSGDDKKSLHAKIGFAEKNKGSLSGTLYQNLEQDLSHAPNYIFLPKQAEQGLNAAIKAFKSEHKTADVTHTKSELMVYIDSDNKAHWAFKTSFYIQSNTARRSYPHYIIDAETFEIYQAWDEVKNLTNVKGGGLGGNLKTGRFFYDGQAGHLPKLNMQRDDEHKICYLKNDAVSVTDYRTNEVVQFSCPEESVKNGNLYWDSDLDSIHGGYSPSNDALYAGKVINKLYSTWYEIPVLKKNNEPMLLEMVTHSLNEDSYGPDPDNALWDPFQKKMFFGDGANFFYPLTSVDVAAHEISHGFTEQNSNLSYYAQSGGMNESFSDMAAQAAEYFVSKTNDWKIGANIILAGDALRYLDNPRKDCEGLEKLPPGENCSLDNVKDYEAYVKRHAKDRNPRTRYPNVHLSSGIFNRVFYELATYEKWNPKKAFDVMVQANRFYWTPSSNFYQAACGVSKATKDYGYELEAVVHAFKVVGIKVDTRKC